MPTEEALASIRNMTAIAPRILFSSAPTDREGVTINLRPTRYWLERFAEAGFAPAPGFDATFLSPYAILFERSDEGRDDRSLAAFAEIVRQRLEVAKVLQTGRETHNRLEREVADLKMIEGQLRSELHSSRIRESKFRRCRIGSPRLMPRGAKVPPPSRRLESGFKPKLPGPTSPSPEFAYSSSPRAGVSSGISSGLPPTALCGPRGAAARAKGTRQGIRQSSLFDAAFYLSNNPDVATNSVNPALHFVDAGLEGRS